MPINIQDSGAIRHDVLWWLLYGLPGVGKSSLALRTFLPLVLDFEIGLGRAAQAGGVPCVQIRDWGRDMGGFAAADLREYKTVVVDTVGAALTLMLDDISRKNPAWVHGGTPDQRAYGALLKQFERFMAILDAAKVDVVIVAHASEAMSNGVMTQRIKAIGQSGDLVLQKADVIGRLWIENGERRLSFDPQFASIGKNPGLPELTIPHISGNEQGLILAEFIGDAKRILNSRSESGRIYYRLLEAEQQADDDSTLMDALNDIVSDPAITPLSDWQPDCKRLLGQIQVRGGLVFDQTERRFVLPTLSVVEEPDAPPAAASNPDSVAPAPPPNPAWDEPSDDPPTGADPGEAPDSLF